MNDSRVARHAIRLLIASALTGSFAEWWSSNIPLEWTLPCGFVGHYLLLSAFAFFINRKPHWSVLLSAIRETVLAAIQLSVVIWIGLLWYMYALGILGLRVYIIYAGSLVSALALLFLVFLAAHMLIHRIRTRQRWLSFTTAQLFFVVLMLSGAVFLNTLNRASSPLFEPTSYFSSHGWPFQFLTVRQESSEIDWKSLLANVLLFAAPILGYLVFFGGIRTSEVPRNLKPRLIALCVLILFVAMLSIPWDLSLISDEFRTDRYGWPFECYPLGGSHDKDALLFNLYSYGVFAMILFAVRSNEASLPTSPPARHSCPSEPPAPSRA